MSGLSVQSPCNCKLMFFAADAVVVLSGIITLKRLKYQSIANHALAVHPGAKLRQC